MTDAGMLKLKDSGGRISYDTGAVRDLRQGKGRFDLLPCHALQRLAQTFEKGAEKYADRNWEQGIPLSRFMDSALRHLTQYLGGARDEDHLAQAAWNVMCLIETQYRVREGLLPGELNDLPPGLYPEGSGQEIRDDLDLIPPNPFVASTPLSSCRADSWDSGSGGWPCLEHGGVMKSLTERCVFPQEKS